MSDMTQEQKSGWHRTLLTFVLGATALAGSTYTVVGKITTFENTQNQHSTIILSIDERIRNLEGARLPDGLKVGQLDETLKSLERVMVRIEQRIERIEMKYEKSKE